MGELIKRFRISGIVPSFDPRLLLLPAGAHLMFSSLLGFFSRTGVWGAVELDSSNVRWNNEVNFIQRMI